MKQVFFLELCKFGRQDYIFLSPIQDSASWHYFKNPHTKSKQYKARVLVTFSAINYISYYKQHTLGWVCLTFIYKELGSIFHPLSLIQNKKQNNYMREVVQIVWKYILWRRLLDFLKHSKSSPAKQSFHQNRKVCKPWWFPGVLAQKFILSPLNLCSSCSQLYSFSTWFYV